MIKLTKKINRELKFGISILGLYLLWAIVWFLNKNFIMGTWNQPYAPEMNFTLELAKPFQKNLILGADVMGRSMAELLSSGLTYSLTMAFLVTFITASTGIVVGYLAVKANAWVRNILDLVINIIFIFPSILIAILIMSVTGQSLKGLIFAMAITGWTGYAKIARGESKRVLNLSFVESAKAIGMGEFRLFFTVVLPNILPIMIVNMVLGISGVIVSEAALGFLGLGGSPYSWGALLSGAKTVLLEAPHVAIILSLSMAGLIIGLNLFGDGLRDYLDPKN